MTDVLTVEFSVSPTLQPTPFQTPWGEDAFLLEVPSLGSDWAQALMAVDEEGVITWNFPTSEGLPESLRAAGQDLVRFLIRRYVGQSPPPTGEYRSIASAAGKKVLKVLAYRTGKRLLQEAASTGARAVEGRLRRYRVRTFSPANYTTPDVASLTSEDWKGLGAGRALLFIHGTFSTSCAGFSSIPASLMNDLYQRYQGRVFAFDHPTVSEDPLDNVRWFVSQIPQGVRLEVDIIYHSRGGLVARTLAGSLPELQPANIRVQKVVFVATPNHGTLLADPTRVGAMLDRVTTILNLVPMPPVVEVLEDILEAAREFGEGAVASLKGIAAMNPRGDFLARLNGVRRGVWEPLYFAIAADYEPKYSPRELVLRSLADQVADRIFQNQPNDLVVPTGGVYEGSRVPGFPIPPSRLLQFSDVNGVDHVRYFRRDETAGRLLEWLRE